MASVREASSPSPPRVDPLSPRAIRPEDAAPAREGTALDEDGLPPNPAQLRSPSGELRVRPRRASWAGDAASLERAQAEFDAEDKTPERDALRSVRRAAVAARKANTVQLCRKFSRGEACKQPACPLRHVTDSSMEAEQIRRATSQRIASETAKAADLVRRPMPAVKYVSDDPAANAALAAQRAVEAGGHGAGRCRAGLQARLGHAHWCDLCSVSFRAAKQHEEHLVGRKHTLALETSEQIVREFRASAWCDAAVPLVAVTSAWTLSAFLDGLPRRSRTHARVTLTLSMSSDEAADERGAGQPLTPTLTLPPTLPLNLTLSPTRILTPTLALALALTPTLTLTRLYGDGPDAERPLGRQAWAAVALPARPHAAPPRAARGGGRPRADCPPLLPPQGATREH